MTVTLRPDQLQAVDRLRAALRTNQSVLLQAPTGFGKTIVASYIALHALQKRRKVVFGVHRKELLKQTSRTFLAFGIPHGFIASGMPANPFEFIQIASADSLKSRRGHLKCNLFVPDECRLWATNTREGMIQEARANGAHIVGLDATPERLDGQPLAALFDTMVNGPSVEWLMERGHLSKYRAFGPVRPDLAGLHTRAGEYVTSELEDRFNKPSIIGDAIKVQRKYATGLRTMVFAFSRKHGKDLCLAYNMAGIRSVYIDGESTPETRTEAIRMFADGEAECLISVNLAIEGFDLSAQVGREVPVEAISLQRPTKSKPMALQMIGRALRPKSSPAIIMDHVNLLETHGLPDEPREWSLEGRAKGMTEAAIATKKCPICFALFRPAANCPDCGHDMAYDGEGNLIEVRGRDVEQIDGEIEEIDLEAIRMARKDEIRSARDVESLVKVAKARGYKAGWVVNLMKARGKHVSIDAVMREMRASA